jgi:formylglycine-generating enzyme required for sulfatase activity/tRNA A-37 threonylcarbamoyl transferase component Bud32
LVDEPGVPPPAPPPPTPSDSKVDELGARLQAALGEGYAVEGRLGAGGFAVVFLVRDVHLKRKLAVKVLSPDVIASHSVLERFRREAETIAQLSHPHIVPLHFIGQKDDLVYLVMEAIHGGSLADRLDREKQLPIDEAARIFSEVASALAHAHKRGVVHRDIKPQNVLLDAESGRALVTDFGIARTAEGGSLTATGMVVGTPAYLSPEQVTGEPSDHRADIYALGVMMYEMLAGQPPFTGPTPTAVLMKRLAGPPPSLKKLRPEIPDPLVEVVDACLATNPDDRLGNAADIVRHLTGHSPVSGGHTTSTHLRVRKAKSRSKAITLGVVAVVIVGAAATGLLMSTRGERARPTARTPVDSHMVLIRAGTYTIGSNTGPAVSRPAHPVQISALGIDAREVTVEDYEPFVQTGRAPAPWPGGGQRPDGNLPVTGVTWGEAAGYCAWRHPDGGRLPSEAEWEAAARGTAGRLYPWGNTWDPNAANTGSRQKGPTVAGSYPGGNTPEGVSDLIGNVWEWTSSPFKPYADSGRASSDLYVIRGGAYNALDDVSTAVFRGRARPATARSDLAATGFRCAMTARRSSP